MYVADPRMVENADQYGDAEAQEGADQNVLGEFAVFGACEIAEAEDGFGAH